MTLVAKETTDCSPAYPASTLIQQLIADVPTTSGRRLLQNALRCISYEEYGASMHYSCSVITKILAMRCEEVSRLVRQLLPLPDMGVRLLRTELGLRAELLKTEYSQQEGETCLRHAIGLHDLLLGKAESSCAEQIPRCTRAEQLIVLLQTLSTRCLESDDSLMRKRLLLKILVLLRLQMSVLLPFAKAQHRTQLTILSVLFHEPLRVARSLLQQYEFYFAYNYAKRLLHLRRMPERSAYLETFYWPDMDAYRQFIAGNATSRVLVTIHMGDFLGAFHRITGLASSDRRAISLRREQHEEENTVVMENINLSVLRHGQNDPVAIVGALRQGNVTLATLFDLKAEFGATATVKFFDQRASFVKGPAQLAIMGRAPILPFVTWEENGVNHLEMESAIDTQPRTGESLHEATTRITQQLVTLAEKWIRRSPAQWKYLTSLPGYFSHE